LFSSLYPFDHGDSNPALASIKEKTMAFVTITAADIDAAFAHGIWTRGHARGETTIECAVKAIPGVVVRVYTSLRTDSGVSAGKGADALRIMAVDTLAEKAKVPACVVNPHKDGPKYLKRTTGWQERVLELARETYREAVKRADWIQQRRVSLGVIAPVAQVPQQVPVKKDLLIASQAAWASLKAKVLAGATVADLKDQIIADTTGESAVAVLFQIYERQTADEQAVGCTKEDNGVGFTGVDAAFATSLVEQVKERHSLSPKQIACVMKMTKKYARQAYESAQS
jgi:hypothetical protein